MNISRSHSSQFGAAEAASNHESFETRLKVQSADSVPVLTQYMRIAMRWRWLIGGSIAVCLAIGIIMTVLMTRMYTASVTLEIARDTAKVVNIQGVAPEAGSLDQEFYQTQYGLLQSRSLAERVVRELNLANNPAFLEMFEVGETSSFLMDERPLDNSPIARERRLRDSISALLDNVSVSPVRASRLVSISFTSPNPELSARIANAWAKGFIETNMERRFDATSYARRFLEERLSQMRGRLDESERALVGYAAREKIINVGARTGSENSREGERSLISEDLVALNQALGEARAERVAAENKFLQAQTRGGGATSFGLTNTAIASLRQDRAEVAAEHAKLSAQFEKTYPPLQALAAQLAQLDRSISREEGRVLSTIEGEFKEAVGRERALAGKVEVLKGGILDLRRRSIQYNIFQRDADTNRALYDGLLARYKEIGVAGGLGTNNVSIVDEAEVPVKPSRPRPLLNLVLALIVGAAIGAGLALAMEQIDEAISDPSDLEKKLGIPALGAVPKVIGVTPFEALADRKSEMTEAYLSIKTSLQFSTDHGIPRTMVITSTRASEGKSTTSLATALTLARQGKKVLLVDADMRSPTVHGLFDLSNADGLSNFLTGEGGLDGKVHASPYENLSVMTAGPMPPNAAELLSGSGLTRLFEDCARLFDHVVFDAPPVMGLADAPLIASRVEGTILVVESHGIRSRIVKVALGRLNNTQARILGAVLTKFENRRAHFGYGYDYGYGYGQGAKA